VDLPQQRFGEPALARRSGLPATMAVREAELAALEDELMRWAEREPLAGPVARLGANAASQELGAITRPPMVGPWSRRFAARAHELHRLGPQGTSYGEDARAHHKAGSEPVRTSDRAPGSCGTPRDGGAAPPPGLAATPTPGPSGRRQRRLHDRYVHLGTTAAAATGGPAVAAPASWPG